MESTELQYVNTHLLQRTELISENLQILLSAVEDLGCGIQAVPDVLVVLCYDEVSVTGEYVMRLLSSLVRCAFTLMVCSGRFNSDVSQNRFDGHFNSYLCIPLPLSYVDRVGFSVNLGLNRRFRPGD